MPAETRQTEKLCSGLNCTKPAKLQCPTCAKLKIEGSHFCSQDCFKLNWTTHKILHTKNADGSYDPFPSMVYSGKIRAQYPLSNKRLIPQYIDKPDHAIDGLPKLELKNRGSTKIDVLSAEEILAMREVCRLSREILDIGASVVKAGVTTDYIDEVIHNACIERKCYPSPLNYHKFPKSCCTSVNEVICHGIPDRRPLSDGDIINIDVSLYFNKHHGDLNQTYLVGNVDPAGKKLINVTKQCLDLAIDACKPGFLYRDLGAIIESHAKNNGFSVARSYCGHGINKMLHATPNVPHYTKNKAFGVMREGHCFTIEPMINEGSYHDIHWPDNWTSVTKDGKRSAQFEHTLLITKDGCDILTAANDERKDNSVNTDLQFNS